MKLSSSRAAFHVKRPMQKNRNTYSQGSLHHRARPQKYHGSAQKIYTLCRVASRRQHHRSEDSVLTFKKRQKILQNRPFRSCCWSVCLYPIRHQPKAHRACAQRTCKSRKVPPCQQHRDKDVARMCSRQRNHAQKIALRVIIFIQRNRNFALRRVFPSMSRRTSMKSHQSRNCAVNYHPNRY